MEVFKEWSDFYLFAKKKLLVVNYEETDVGYRLFSIEGPVIYKCNIRKGSQDAQQFEQKQKQLSNMPMREQEREQARPKLVSGQADTVDGVATVFLKIPGTPGESLRYLKGGFGWFGNPGHGDKIKVYLTDEDNMMGEGSGYTVASFNDEEAEEQYRGWLISPHDPIITVEGFEDYMEIASGLYLKVVAIKGDSSSDTFYMNLYQGERTNGDS
ncbi:MAG: hypothetical protein GWN64_07935 [Candidatus Thorarchaeota archaeon]|nr:hypothetical protein [Candidatus Thorarchaeota archaeon]